MDVGHTFLISFVEFPVVVVLTAWWVLAVIVLAVLFLLAFVGMCLGYVRGFRSGLKHDVVAGPVEHIDAQSIKNRPGRGEEEEDGDIFLTALYGSDDKTKHDEERLPTYHEG